MNKINYLNQKSRNSLLNSKRRSRCSIRLSSSSILLLSIFMLTLQCFCFYHIVFRCSGLKICRTDRNFVMNIPYHVYHRNLNMVALHVYYFKTYGNIIFIYKIYSVPLLYIKKGETKNFVNICEHFIIPRSLVM